MLKVIIKLLSITLGMHCTGRITLMLPPDLGLWQQTNMNHPGKRQMLHLISEMQ